MQVPAKPMNKRPLVGHHPRPVMPVPCNRDSLATVQYFSVYSNDFIFFATSGPSWSALYITHLTKGGVMYPCLTVYAYGASCALIAHSQPQRGKRRVPGS